MGGEPDKPCAAWRWHPLPESCQLLGLAVGASHPITSEHDEKTYWGTMTAPEKLSAEMMLERGGTSVVMDAAGNLYLASGQIFIYNKQLEQIGILEVPERPSSLACGGADGETLFIARARPCTRSGRSIQVRGRSKAATRSACFRPMMERLFAPRGRDSLPRWCRQRPWFRLWQRSTSATWGVQSRWDHRFS